MRRLLLPLITLLLTASLPAAAQEVRYDVSFPNGAHHEAEVRLVATGLPRGKPAELRMSRSSPGRYALHEFAKNVYQLSVTDGAGRPLEVTRADPYSWRVAGHDGTVTVRYTLFGNRGDGTYLQVDRTHAHLNIPATFMWVKGLDARPVRVTFHPPEGSGWKVATQLFPTDDPLTFTAPGFQYFMDSPTELSAYTLREWNATVNGKSWPIRIALHHTGTGAEADSFAKLAQRVVNAHMKVFREAPRFDVGYYTFIADYLPWAAGDGMEHRNSTIISSTGSLAGNMDQLLSTLSHEFFHAWNVERLRPRNLEPFDFSRANMSDALWFAEGFTNYYGPLAMVRAGVASLDDFAEDLSGPISFVVNSPARNYFNALEMSMQAPFVDAATSIDPNNRGNTFISYYTWGSVIAAGLDLTLRQRGHDLDELMRLMWARHGRNEVPYTVDDIEKALGDLTGDKAFARDFFARYIRGREVVNFAPLLAQGGFLLRPAHPGAAWLGAVNLDITADGARIVSSTQVGSPLYKAGLDAGDIITSVDGTPMTSDSAWQAVKAAHKPGDQVQVKFVSRDQDRSAVVTLEEDPRLEVVTFEKAGMPVTEQVRTFRSAWLWTP